MFQPERTNGLGIFPFYYSSRSLLVHPVTLFVVVWGLVIFLYSLHLSELLVFSTATVLNLTLWIVLPFVASVLAVQAFCEFVPQRGVIRRDRQTIVPQMIERQLLRWFVFWAACSVVEIVVSGGLPIVWLFQGDARTYMDFGIPSLHGLLNSMLLAIGFCEFGLFCLDGKKRHLYIPGWILLWATLVVTRNMMIVMLLQCGIIWGLVRGVRKRFLFRVAIVVMLLILLFGYLGDLRSGADSFRAAAVPTDEYPEWLPSGVLWIYIYLATPIGNLVNTTANVAPKYDLLFPNTAALLFPTVIRKLVYGESSLTAAMSGELLVDAFNVSTAYVGPYQDFGRLGMVCFSILFGLIASYFWRARSFRDALIYGVLGQCVLLSVFFNHLFDPPIISQIGWLFIFLRKGGTSLTKSGMKHPDERKPDSDLRNQNLA